MKSKTVSVSIDCDPETAYEFVANLKNLKNAIENS